MGKTCEHVPCRLTRGRVRCHTCGRARLLQARHLCVVHILEVRGVNGHSLRECVVMSLGALEHTELLIQASG
jgi:hypothetical protein